MASICLINTAILLLIVGSSASGSGNHKQWGLPHVDENSNSKDLSDLIGTVNNLGGLSGSLQDNVKRYNDCKSQYDSPATAVTQCLPLLTSGFSSETDQQVTIGDDPNYAQFLADQQALLSQNPGSTSVTVDITSSSTTNQQQQQQQQNFELADSLDRENRSKSQAAQVVGQALGLGLGAVAAPVTYPEGIYQYPIPPSGYFQQQGYGNAYTVPAPGAWGYSSYSQYPVVQGAAFGAQYAGGQAIPGYVAGQAIPGYVAGQGAEFGAGQGVGFVAGQGAGFGVGQSAGFVSGQGAGYGVGQTAGFGASQGAGVVAGQGAGFGAGAAGVQTDFTSQQTVQTVGSQGQGQIDTGMQYPEQSYWGQKLGQYGSGLTYQNGGQYNAGFTQQNSGQYGTGYQSAQSQVQPGYASQTTSTTITKGTGGASQYQGQADYSTANSGIQFPLQGVVTQAPGQPASGILYSAQGGSQVSGQQADVSSQYSTPGQSAYGQFPGQATSSQYYYQGASQYPAQTSQGFTQDEYSAHYGAQAAQSTGQVGSTQNGYSVQSGPSTVPQFGFGYSAQGSQGVGQTVAGSSQYGYGAQGIGQTVAGSSQYGYGIQGAGQTVAGSSQYGYGAQGVGQTAAGSSQYGYGAQGAGQTVAGSSQYGYGTQGVGQTVTGSSQYGYGAQGAGQTLAGSSQYGYGAQGSQTQGVSQYGASVGQSGSAGSQYGFDFSDSQTSAQQSASGGSSQYGFTTSAQTSPTVSQYWVQLQPVQQASSYSYQYQQPSSGSYYQAYSQQPATQSSGSGSTYRKKSSGTSSRQ